MAKFWTEWRVWLVKPWSGITKAVGVYKAVVGLGFSLASVGAAMWALRSYDVTIPWWILGLVFATASYLLLTAGIAMGRANGLSLAVEGSYFDARTGEFVLDVKNSSRARVKFQAQVSQIWGSNAQRLDNSPYTPYWRNCPDPLVRVLQPGFTASLVLLVVVCNASPENRYVGVWNQKDKLEPLTLHGKPFCNGPLRIAVTISYSSQAGEFGGTETREFNAIVDTESLTGSRI